MTSSWALALIFAVSQSQSIADAQPRASQLEGADSLVRLALCYPGTRVGFSIKYRLDAMERARSIYQNAKEEGRAEAISILLRRAYKNHGTKTPNYYFWNAGSTCPNFRSGGSTENSKAVIFQLFAVDLFAGYLDQEQNQTSDFAEGFCQYGGFKGFKQLRTRTITAGDAGTNRALVFGNGDLRGIGMFAVTLDPKRTPVILDLVECE